MIFKVLAIFLLITIEVTLIDVLRRLDPKWQELRKIEVTKELLGE